MNSKPKKTKKQAEPQLTKHPEESKQQTLKVKPDFPIVGLGASAGGLEALEVFFEHLPEKSGMAFVVILHLSPKHESHLAELLQKHTVMVVIEVTETVTVEPDYVYIIPPNKKLSLADGKLRLSSLEESPLGRRALIDQFFRSLARAHSDRAVCIVLSGTGSDGTLGLKAVKEHGGFTMVQAPEDAKHDGMPRSAIATGLADCVLPVKALAEKLVVYKQSRATIPLPEQEKDLPEDGVDALRKILAQVLGRTGHDFTAYKRSTVLRRLTRRLQVNQIPDFSSYLRFLRRNPEETQALFNDLLICVTNFFRDLEAFETLEKKVIPKLFEGRGSEDPVRVWVAGCATGEEAYSVAMLFVEHAARLDRAPQIQIFATDVSEDAIATARQGLYPTSIAADVTPERLNQFFTEEAGSYRIRPALREVILFAVHDLIRAPPFSKLHLISCRNLLIYLNQDLQQRVFELFHYGLLPDGYLFLGTAESADATGDLFAAKDKKQHIYQRAAIRGATPYFPVLPLVIRDRLAAPGLEAGTGRRSPTFGELHQLLLEQYAPPSLVVNEHYDIVHVSERAGQYLQFPMGEPTYNLMKVIRPGLWFEFRTAFFHAFRKGEAVTSKWVSVDLDGARRRVRLIVRPAKTLEGRPGYILVIFEEAPEPEAAADEQQTEGSQATNWMLPTEANLMIEQQETEIQGLKEHLQTTIEQYETSTEELKASNEELQSINEELKSATEELETSKEELQSTNEELVTLNQEHRNKIEELAETNSDLQNLMASTNIGTLFLDRELCIRRFTPRITKLFNIATSDRGRPVSHFTHKLGYDGLIVDAEQVLDRLTPVEREIHTEQDQWYLVRMLPYRTVEDKIDGVVITFVEITARKQAEIAIQQARDYAEHIVETIHEPLMVLDSDMKVLSANRSFYQSFSLRPEQTQGRLFYDLGNRQWDIPALRELLETILPEHTTMEKFEVAYALADVGERVLILNARQILTAPGNSPKILLALEDVTERKRARQEQERLVDELEEKNAELERFVYTISHDLKSPLITIMGYLDMLEKDLAEDDVEAISRDIQTILAGAKQMGRLLENLLELSRIGRVVSLPETVGLTELAHEAAQMVAGQITERGVEVVIAQEMPVVVGDRTRLLEVLQNLIDNAVKYMGDQPAPHIAISGKEEGQEVMCSIQDNGIGINPRYHKKVFGLFERLDQRIDGTGVGLALVQRIVEMHGGRVWVKSEGEGHGSLFCFTLPAKPL